MTPATPLAPAQELQRRQAQLTAYQNSRNRVARLS